MAKTYTTVVDKSSGDQFSEAMWDTMLKDNINNLIVPPTCRIRHNANQTTTTGAEFTPILYNTEDWDTDGMHSTSSNTGRITPTTTGLYFVTVEFVFASNATGDRVAYIKYNNGSDIYLAEAGFDAPGTGGFSAGIHANTIWENTSGSHYFFSAAIQSSGGNLDITGNLTRSPAMAALWVGRTS